MSSVLIVDDSSMMLAAIKKKLIQTVEADFTFAKSYSEVEELLKTKTFHVALLDLHLPDAPNGEVVALVDEHKIPSIVLTGLFDDTLRDIILQKNVIDFINKGDKDSIAYAAKSINRVLKNYETNILIVDDSRVYRTALSQILRKMHINVITATDGLEALSVLQNSSKKISIVVTDYQMPNMDGMQLTMRIREFYKKDELGVVVVSTLDTPQTITQFLKIGANDYIVKPFTYEEVAVRVNTNLELLELFEETKNLANKDFLTGAYNRRFFFDSGSAIFEKNKRQNRNVCVAMLDIDKFKKVNDTYGHMVGDVAIKSIKQVLDKVLRTSDLMARFGGEEFCILLEHITLDNSVILMEKIRKEIEENYFEADTNSLHITVSIGVCFGQYNTLEQMIQIADEALYDAKNNGRNQVVYREGLTTVDSIIDQL